MEEPQVMSERISRRIAAIAPSSTLAVDAQAKALKAEGVEFVGLYGYCWGTWEGFSSK